MAELPPMIQALMNPVVYPEPAGRVELVQTQMSFVLLAGDYVYKIKKPVNLGYLDYSTLEKRQLFCHKEVNLNRRLCPETYLGVVAINEYQGRYTIDGSGEVVEYAVKMRRLPQELMMDALLVENRVSLEMIDRMAKKVAAFHKGARTGGEIEKFGSLETIIHNTEENFSQTEKYFGRAISQQQYQGIMDYTRSFTKDNDILFKRRVWNGYIRDCHGDLHTAHICFRNGICIYDCIEFNDRFRYGDVASEVAFLAMDLDHHGRADLSRSFVDSYIVSSRDGGLKKMLNFYKCYRAYIRGKVACFKLDDPYISEEERAKALEDAVGYFDLAYSYAVSQPTLFITTGMVGSGKSVLAQALAGRLGLVVISSDVTRKRLASIPETEHHFEEFDTGIYTPEFSRKTYDTMFAEAKSILSEGGSVIMDAAFIKSDERLRAMQLAEEAGARFFVLECRLEEGLTRQRLEQRLKEGSVSDGRWEVYLKQKERYQPPVEAPPDKRVIIDSSQSVAETVRQVIDTVNRRENNDNQ